jgi:hypothetical protein
MAIVLTLSVTAGNEFKEMPRSLFSTETQGTFDQAAKMAGQRGRPVSISSRLARSITLFHGVLAVSRILNEQEVIVVANTSISQSHSVEVILEILLSQENTNYPILYCIQNFPEVPSPVRKTGAVTVHEVNGSIGNGRFMSFMSLCVLWKYRYSAIEISIVRDLT